MKSRIVESAEHEDQHAADPTDRAGAEVESSTQEARYAHRLAMKANGDLPEPSDDGTCVEEDCGLPVEPERIALGLARCLSCAEAHERKRQRRIRGF